MLREIIGVLAFHTFDFTVLKMFPAGAPAETIQSNCQKDLPATPVYRQYRLQYHCEILRLFLLTLYTWLPGSSPEFESGSSRQALVPFHRAWPAPPHRPQAD